MNAFSRIQETMLQHMLSGKEGDPMHNATLMAADYPERSLQDFITNEEEHQTGAYIEALKKSNHLSHEEVITEDSEGNILMHHLLAMKFASYLDVHSFIRHLSKVPAEEMRKQLEKSFNK